MPNYSKRPKTLQLKIIERFYNEKEISDFLEEYKLNRLRSWGFEPSESDWKLLEKENVSVEDFTKHWKLKNSVTAFRRLGKMSLMSSRKK